jgi:hypothetical protein
LALNPFLIDILNNIPGYEIILALVIPLERYSLPREEESEEKTC